MGKIIAKYDDVYRKELPECARDSSINMTEADEIWDTYLHKIVFPDYRVTDQHRSWIGYTLKGVLTGILENADSDNAGLFVQRYLRLFSSAKMKEDSAVFVLLDSVISLPDGIFSDEEMADVLDLQKKVSNQEPVEIKRSLTESPNTFPADSGRRLYRTASGR